VLEEQGEVTLVDDDPVPGSSSDKGKGKEVESATPHVDLTEELECFICGT
jgi:hypothetical protein